MTAWRTNMLIYPSSWGWRHKTSIGMFKQGYYPTFCIAPLFLAPGERLEALTAFSKLAFRLPRWEYVNAHMQHAHRSVVCFRAISVATDVSSHSPRLFHYWWKWFEGCTICNTPIAGAYHHDSGISTEHFEHICRPTLCPLGRSKSLPLPALASQGPSTRRSGQTLQHFNAY